MNISWIYTNSIKRRRDKRDGESEDSVLYSPLIMVSPTIRETGPLASGSKNIEVSALFI